MVTISTPEELLRVLRENPEWKEAVRREILTEELLNLPARFDRFVAKTERFQSDTEQAIGELRQFHDDQRQFNDDQRKFNDDQRKHNDRVDESIARIDRSIDRLRKDTSNMRATHARDEATREAGAIASDMGYMLVRILTVGDLAEMAARADTSDLNTGALISFRRGDLIMETADPNGVTHYIAMEISYTGDQRDTNRAIRNAGLLTRFTGHPAHPAIGSIRNVYEIQQLIDSGQVYWHQMDDREEPAE